jgi:hypothetical protein
VCPARLVMRLYTMIRSPTPRDVFCNSRMLRSSKTNHNTRQRVSKQAQFST